jgi:hypothetical protein
MDEMGDGVGEESAAEEISDVVIPAHAKLLSLARRNVTGFAPISQKPRNGWARLIAGLPS